MKKNEVSDKLTECHRDGRKPFRGEKYVYCAYKELSPCQYRKTAPENVDNIEFYQDDTKNKVKQLFRCYNSCLHYLYNSDYIPVIKVEK